MEADLIFENTSLYQFPNDPEQRIFTLEQLFGFAATRLVKSGHPVDGITVDSLAEIVETGFANGTVVEILAL